MKYKAVIFDLDGTLLNTLDDLADSVNYVLKKHGFKERTLDEIRRFVGNGIYKLVKRSLPEGVDEAVIQSCYTEFSEYYKLNMMNKTKLYDGIEELLERLNREKIKLAVVTNKADFAAQELCKMLFGDKKYIAVGSDINRPNKPAPDNVFLAMKKMNVSAEDTVYIGDSEVDAQTAENAGLDFIAVLWGFRTREDLIPYNPKYTAETVSELEKILFLG